MGVKAQVKKVSRADLQSEETEAFSGQYHQQTEAAEALMALENRLKANFTSQDVFQDADSDAESDHSDQDTMVFKLFSAPVKTISLEVQQEEPTLRPETFYDAQEDEEQLEKFASAAIAYEHIIIDSKIPWERNFFLNKVTVVPFGDPPKPKLSKSKKRRLREKSKKEERLFKTPRRFTPKHRN